MLKKGGIKPRQQRTQKLMELSCLETSVVISKLGVGDSLPPS